MASLHHGEIQQLRVAFALRDLHYLESIDEFCQVLTAGDRSIEALNAVIQLGNELLALRQNRKEKLAP